MGRDCQSLCDDVWSFDLDILSWRRLNIQLKVKLGFEPIGYGNKVFLFGGMIDPTLLNRNVEILSLLDDKKVCKVCENIYVPFEGEKESEEVKGRLDKIDQQIEFNIKFFEKLAKMIQHPFHAIALLLDNSFNMHSTSISISLHFSHAYFLLIADNSKPQTSSSLKTQLSTFSYECTSTETENWNPYAINLIMAALRLGKSFIFVSQTLNGEKCVASFNERQ